MKPRQAALAVVLIVVGLLGAGCGSSDRTGTGGPGVVPTGAPEPPAGMRWIGKDDIVVAVPVAWTDQQPRCIRPTVSYYAFFQPINFMCPYIKTPGPQKAVTSLVIGTLNSATGAPATQEVVNGLPITHSVLTCETLTCFESVAVTGSNVSFLITAPSNQARQVIGSIVASVRRLPSGFTTVPFVGGQPGLAAALEVLRHAGLRTTGAPGSRTSVVGTDPPAGFVAPIGSTVTVTTAAG